MIERTVTIVNKAGMHTRPASNIVKIASKYRSDFYIVKNGYSINGKSIIGVMTLAAEQGSKLTLKLDGDDEQKAADELQKFFDEGFGEL
jgi:phosphocarrier protein HPr